MPGLHTASFHFLLRLPPVTDVSPEILRGPCCPSSHPVRLGFSLSAVALRLERPPREQGARIRRVPRVPTTQAPPLCAPEASQCFGESYLPIDYFRQDGLKPLKQPDHLRRKDSPGKCRRSRRKLVAISPPQPPRARRDSSAPSTRPGHTGLATQPAFLGQPQRHPCA